eukprot:CAMPEP_0167751082 /NCGR_PEP_ID=MMETSP0110_2-20121227/6361_1 /TAXON_ID=629695 /ORGANISM="Gymnochlora sp., Strain CCMP2014" /LENGTH=389 /DNA_ID=CAMNT_0007636499 /DNA_START=27 /DNA_END=1194 /DNA_ORIENTATION=+
MIIISRKSREKVINDLVEFFEEEKAAELVDSILQIIHDGKATRHNEILKTKKRSARPPKSKHSPQTTTFTVTLPEDTELGLKPRRSKEKRPTFTVTIPAEDEKDLPTSSHGKQRKDIIIIDDDVASPGQTKLEKSSKKHILDETKTQKKITTGNLEGKVVNESNLLMKHLKAQVMQTKLLQEKLQKQAREHEQMKKQLQLQQRQLDKQKQRLEHPEVSSGRSRGRRGQGSRYSGRSGRYRGRGQKRSAPFNQDQFPKKKTNVAVLHKKPLENSKSLSEIEKLKIRQKALAALLEAKKQKREFEKKRLELLAKISTAKSMNMSNSQPTKVWKLDMELDSIVQMSRRGGRGGSKVGIVVVTVEVVMKEGVGEGEDFEGENRKIGITFQKLE